MLLYLFFLLTLIMSVYYRSYWQVNFKIKYFLYCLFCSSCYQVYLAHQKNPGIFAPNLHLEDFVDRMLLGFNIAFVCYFAFIQFVLLSLLLSSSYWSSTFGAESNFQVKYWLPFKGSTLYIFISKYGRRIYICLMVLVIVYMDLEAIASDTMPDSVLSDSNSQSSTRSPHDRGWSCPLLVLLQLLLHPF